MLGGRDSSFMTFYPDEVIGRCCSYRYELLAVLFSSYFVSSFIPVAARTANLLAVGHGNDDEWARGRTSAIMSWLFSFFHSILMEKQSNE